MKNYLISWHDSEKNTGGVKAKKDVETFLKQEYFNIIDTPRNKIGKLLFTFIILPIKLIFSRPDNIVVQFPTGTFKMLKIMIMYIKLLSRSKLIFLIHDLETLRNWRNQEIEESDNVELKLLKKADGIISLNNIMTNWLKEKGIACPIRDMRIWDYDNDLEIKNYSKYNGSVGLAGNLKKSTFPSKFDDREKIVLYGPNPLDKYPKNVKYKGSFSSDELLIEFSENWGLVWDGTSLDKCSGKFGEYLRINNPHKLSMYLSAGIPVIIWKDAALASIVENNKLGILVDRIDNLNEVTSSVTNEQYFEIQENVKKFAVKLRNGEFLKVAMRELLRDLKN